MPHFPPGKIAYHSPQGTFTLRPLRIEDTPAIFLARKMSEPSLKRFFAWAHQPCTMELQHEWVAKSISNYYLLKEVLNLGFFDPQHHFIGMGGWTKSNPLNQDSYEIGYWMSSPYQNKGYGTIIGKLLVYTAFSWMEATRMAVNVHTSNRPSQRVIEKCGFHYEGLVRNLFGNPTSEMLANGYEPGNDGLSYSLLPNDIQLLPWYEDILLHTEIKALYPELEHTHPLPHTRSMSAL